MKLPTKDSDPSGLVGMVATFVGAILGLLVAFGVDLTPDQVKAVVLVVTTGGPLVVALLIQRWAWAPDTVDRELANERALYTGMSFSAPDPGPDDGP